jgi:hypothetical protein
MSLFVSTHRFPQRVNPGLQVKPHVEALQAGDPLVGAVHARPHAPQLDVSDMVLMHSPVQFVSGVAHVEPQAPPEQTSTAAQTFSHRPQFSLLDCRLTHSPPQFL